SPRRLGVERALDEAELEPLAAMLEAEARAEIESQAMALASVHVERTARLKYRGSDSSLAVPMGPHEQMAEAFHQAHRRRFGFDSRADVVMVDSLEVEAVGEMEGGLEPPSDPGRSHPAEAAGR